MAVPIIDGNDRFVTEFTPNDTKPSRIFSDSLVLQNEIRVLSTANDEMGVGFAIAWIALCRSISLLSSLEEEEDGAEGPLDFIKWW
jgi:hypothetical protein